MAGGLGLDVFGAELRLVAGVAEGLQDLIDSLVDLLAQKTIFLARYLRSRALQREIHEGLNVVESWNRASAVIFYGKGGDLASNRRDEQEMSVLCLRILQAALVYVNTLMIQDLLAEPGWDDVLTPEDQRGLTPLFWSHVLPYGEVKLNMTSRLLLGTT